MTSSSKKTSCMLMKIGMIVALFLLVGCKGKKPIEATHILDTNTIVRLRVGFLNPSSIEISSLSKRQQLQKWLEDVLPNQPEYNTGAVLPWCQIEVLTNDTAKTLLWEKDIYTIQSREAPDNGLLSVERQKELLVLLGQRPDAGSH